MVDELENMIWWLDEPQADPAPINALFISQLARQHGIKVLLSGAGGDDIFTGYRRHYALVREPYWSWLPSRVRGSMRAVASRIRPTNEFQRRLSKAFRYANLEGDDRIAAYFHWIDMDHLSTVFGPDLNREMTDSKQSPVHQALASLPAEVPALNRMLYLESKFFLTDHNLNYVDKVSMASGVEVRVPLIDPDLVSLAARLPLHLKQKGRVGKWILRKAMEPYLPKAVLHRGKTGFGAPLRHWLRHDLRPMVDDVLSERAIRERGLFDPEGVRKMVEQDRKRQYDASYTIFSMMCIELWCRMFIDHPVPSLDRSCLGSATENA